MNENEKIFAACKQCDRPYKKGPNFPDEVCSFCKEENKDSEEEQ